MWNNALHDNENCCCICMLNAFKYANIRISIKYIKTNEFQFNTVVVVQEWYHFVCSTQIAIFSLFVWFKSKSNIDWAVYRWFPYLSVIILDLAIINAVFDVVWRNMITVCVVIVNDIQYYWWFRAFTCELERDRKFRLNGQNIRINIKFDFVVQCS